MGFKPRFWCWGVRNLTMNRTLRLTNMRHDMTWKKTINGKACSEKKFNKYWKKYYTNTTKITYHAIWPC